ncbi:Aca2/YdiL-like domain-containing protein [Erwinia sorbitola]|uniref:DUF1870 family protein n=1 Tax=Erwinia sorbitola TaxID=2681984 RepID=A0ABW9R9L7_9GAMM|nr:DUF1870 family protein [Erwinia sorbitola]MTD26309.1 DUF1870 family protein [Erwinia sorbitola]
MNYLELQALRHIFLLSIEEAASHIAKDNDPAAWKKRELGQEEISEKIIHRFEELLIQRQHHMNAIIDKINLRIGNNTMKYFPTFEEFKQARPGEDLLAWKTYQSVAAELYSRGLERLC